jgi:hypothetical protein
LYLSYRALENERLCFPKTLCGYAVSFGLDNGSEGSLAISAGIDAVPVTKCCTTGDGDVVSDVEGKADVSH